MVGDLCPGTYKLRLVRGGPWVAAELTYGPPLDPETGEPLERSWRWQVRLNGVAYERHDMDEMIWRVHTSPRIGQAEHDHMVEVARWAREEAPGLPEANERDPVDLRRMESLF